MVTGQILTFIGLTMLSASEVAAAHAQVVPVALTGATVYAGERMKPLRNAVILINDDRITAIGRRSTVKIPSNAKIVDYSGRWVVPGLINAHVHFFESGRSFSSPRRFDLTNKVTFQEEARWTESRAPVTLAAYLCAGVTSTISLGGPQFEYRVRDLAATIPAPNVFVAYGPVTAVPSDLIFPRFSGEVSVRKIGLDKTAADAVSEAKYWNSDLIKTGLLGGPFSALERGYFDFHATMVRTAHAAGLAVTTHATEVEPARRFLKQGVDSLQHVPGDALVDPGFVVLAKAKRAIFVPTLSVIKRSFIDFPTGEIALLSIEQRCGDPQVIDSWSAFKPFDDPGTAIISARTRYAISVENVRRLYLAGVPIAAGDDAGAIGLLHGPTLHLELALLQDAGMKPVDILRAATVNAARVARKDGDVGSLSRGKLADLLILDADPGVSAANLQQIIAVYKSGLLVNSR